MEPLLIALFFVAVVSLLIYSTVVRVRDDGPNGRVRSKSVKVVRRRTQLTVVSPELPTTTTYLVSFQPIYQRHVLEFAVDQQQYDVIFEGATGVLRHKGWQFVSFTPDTHSYRTRG